MKTLFKNMCSESEAVVLGLLSCSPTLLLSWHWGRSKSRISGSWLTGDDQQENSKPAFHLGNISSILCIYCSDLKIYQFSSLQKLSRVRLFATPWIAACQASLSITKSQSSLRLTSIESVMPSSHLILCSPLLLLPTIPPSIRVFSIESTLHMSGQSTGVSALASFLPKKSQGWSPSEWTGWISLQPKGLSRVFSNTTVQKHKLFGAQLSL